ncbi:adenylate/guanylate cyclase domain-containing protein [Ruegeria profundi]|uniref:adenylate/guanylate cyclase domain-containing protein n=1 Tax=Ruegeria profundi TaxID=1685378 RepID=UPI001CD41D79|nr:adenylate/guanylate cyclase domain-containing protein [Ruegeria profundi]MCA0928807.1 adenylate/guanylate cyclase domain-containing protein [Ruegeria profundi]
MKALLQFLLKVPDGLSSEQERLHVFFRFGYANAAIVHLLYSVVFALNGVTWLAWYNVAVTALFVLGAVIWSRLANPLWLFVTLWIIEIPLHALLGTLATGVMTMFWIVPITTAILSLITPSFSWLTRTVLACCSTIYVGFLFSLGFMMQPSTPLTTASEIVLFLFNYAILGAMVFYVGAAQHLVQIAEAKQQEEFDRAEGLLLNILPASIAQRLKSGERVIADNHKEVSVVFADIVDFTSVSSKLTPAQLVETLNLVFSEFDTLSERHGAEKIKTIGDAYMVVVGVPNDRHNHAEAAVNLAREMQAAVAFLRDKAHFDLRLRVGINSGPVVAGVIGQRKFAYDLWGDAVNVASRMESHGEPGMIMITQVTADLLPDSYKVIPQGKRDVKGKGQMSVFSVEPSEQ